MPTAMPCCTHAASHFRQCCSVHRALRPALYKDRWIVKLCWCNACIPQCLHAKAYCLLQMVWLECTHAYTTCNAGATAERHCNFQPFCFLCDAGCALWLAGQFGAHARGRTAAAWDWKRNSSTADTVNGGQAVTTHLVSAYIALWVNISNFEALVPADSKWVFLAKQVYNMLWLGWLVRRLLLCFQALCWIDWASFHWPEIFTWIPHRQG